MRKMTIPVLCIFLICMLTLNCLAAGTGMTLTDAQAQTGETVYLTLSLSEPVAGNTLGVSVDYDVQILQFVPTSCSWAKEGVLQDFNKKGSGVWASTATEELQGAVCVLAFHVDEAAEFDQTTVSCKLIVKDGSNEVGTYTADATVTFDCEHQFGQWEDAGAVGHSRVCTHCGQTQTENHSWDEGKISEKETGSDVRLKIYTCGICGATKQREVPAEGTENTLPTVRPTVPTEETTLPTYPTKPTEPVTGQTKPTEPTVKPTEPRENTLQTKPTEPSDDKESVPYTDYNTPTVVGGEEEIPVHDEHVHEEAQLIIGQKEDGSPIILPAGTESQQIIEPEHDHTHEVPVEPAQISPASVAAVLGLVVIAVIACVLLLKKKR